MCIHILWNSTVFLCTPSFSVFPQNMACSSEGRKNHQLPLRGIVSASAQGRDQGKEAEFPLFPVSLFHVTHSEQSNNTDFVQHRCIALQFQMIFLACPLCCETSAQRVVLSNTDSSIFISQATAKANLEKSLARCSNCLMLAVSSNTQLFKN